MKKSIGLVLFILSFNLCAAALRCQHRLVDLGSTTAEVAARCGQPDSVTNRTKIIGSTLRHPRRTLDIQQYEEIQVEEWIYNFGRARLQQYLRFENGILVDIKDLGRGF